VFAAALKENGRATLVGVRADKGRQLIESVYNLDDGSQLRIDTSRWQTPKNNDFSGVGYPVDVELKLTAADKHAGKGPWWKVATTNPRSGQPNATRDLQLLKAKEVLRDIVIRTANTPVSPVETEFKEGGTLSF
jgi:C-terminal processing protease CtpA/Prc